MKFIIQNQIKGDIFNKMFKRCLTLIFLALFSSASLIAFQNSRIDSLQSIYDASSGEDRIDAGNALSLAFLDSDPGRSEELMTILIEESERLSYNEGLIDALNNKADFLTKRHNYYAANELLGKSIGLARKNNDLPRLSKANWILGWNLQRLYKYDTAISVYLEGIKLVKAQGNFKSELNYLTNIGIVKTELNDFESADEYLQEALVIGKENNLKPEMGRVYANLGILEFDRANYSLAKEYHLKSYEIFKILDIKVNLGILLTHLGRVSSKMNEIEKSLNFFERALALREEFDGPRAVASVLRYKAQALASANRMQESQLLVLEALPIAKDFGDLILMEELYTLGVDLAERRQDYKAALGYYREMVIVQDSARSRAGKETVDRLTAEFDFKRLVLEKEFESEQVKVKDLKINQRNLIIVILVLSLVCTLVLFVFVRQRLKKRMLVVQKDKLLTESESKLKSYELTAKSEQIQAYAEELSRIKTESNQVTKTDQLTRMLEVGHLQAKDWASFRISFEELFPNFFPFLEKHSLTVNEERLSCLIKLGLATKEMAQVLAITPNSIIKAKSRLSSKLNLSTQEIDRFMKDH